MKEFSPSLTVPSARFSITPTMPLFGNACIVKRASDGICYRTNIINVAVKCCDVVCVILHSTICQSRNFVIDRTNFINVAVKCCDVVCVILHSTICQSRNFVIDRTNNINVAVKCCDGLRLVSITACSTSPIAPTAKLPLTLRLPPPETAVPGVVTDPKTAVLSCASPTREASMLARASATSVPVTGAIVCIATPAIYCSRRER